VPAPPGHGDPGCEPGLPELLLTFTDARLRGQGHGAALLRELEGRLAGHGVKAYQVRTVLDPSNAALAFYRANGFAPVGVSRRLGTNFQVLVKLVPSTWQPVVQPPLHSTGDASP
jgi:GNAT superfamily N-acetyltransferase